MRWGTVRWIRRAEALGVRVFLFLALPGELCARVSSFINWDNRIMRTKLDVFFKALFIKKKKAVLLACLAVLEPCFRKSYLITVLQVSPALMLQPGWSSEGPEVVLKTQIPGLSIFFCVLEAILVAEPQCIRTPFLSDSNGGPNPGATGQEFRDLVTLCSYSCLQGPTGPPGSGPQFSFTLYKK